MVEKKKIVVVGVGPVGALAAIYAAERGHDVEVYELRSGMSCLISRVYLNIHRIALEYSSLYVSVRFYQLQTSFHLQQCKKLDTIWTGHILSQILLIS